MRNNKIRKDKRSKKDAFQDKLKHELASYMHETWSNWMRYMLSLSHPSEHENGGMVIPLAMVAMWSRQMVQTYDQLSSAEQSSDIKEALKILEIIDRIVKEYGYVGKK
jgi:hypothetical protein